LVGHLAGEIARVRHGGGFLSLLVLGPGARATVSPEPRLETLAESLRGHIRPRDVLGILQSAVAVLMPDTTAIDATRVGEGLVRTVGEPHKKPRLSLSAGSATVFGDVEGGGPALVAAAEEALQEALPQQIACSPSLRGRPWVPSSTTTCPRHRCSRRRSPREGLRHTCASVQDPLQRVADPRYRALFVSLMLPPGRGRDILRRAIASQPSRPAVLMSGYGIERTMMSTA
jgi:hypothetical protein